MRPWLLAALLVLPTLAGCLGGDEGDGPLTNASTNDSEVLPTALPDEREGEFAAFKETNKTDDYGAHDHDYWNGATRVVLVEDTIRMQYDTDEASRTYYLPQGQLVYEGTGTLEVLIDAPRRESLVDDPALSQGLAVQFLHAASDPDGWVDAGQAQWGVPLEIDVVSATWTDMPHGTGSLWAFRFTSPNGYDGSLVFDLTITILKAGEPPKWPGHPVFYDEETRYRELFDGPVEVREGRLAPAWTSMEPAKLVAAGTKTLLVWANITSVEGRPYEPTHWALWYHNASSRSWILTDPFLEEYQAGKESYLFVIPVDANAMDGPYATESRWEFFVRGAFTSPVISCVYGCVDYTVTYDFTVIATDHELPEEAYTPLRRN